MVETPQWSHRADAISAIFHTNYRRPVGLATLLVDDQQTAEDVVQEAFTVLDGRWRQLRDPDAAITYLNRAVVNAGRDHLRYRRRATAGRLALVPRPEELPSAEHEAAARDEADRLWRAICDSDGNVRPGAFSSELWHRYVADYIAAPNPLNRIHATVGRRDRRPIPHRSDAPTVNRGLVVGRRQSPTGRAIR